MNKAPNIEYLLLYTKVVEAGSFSKVASSLGIPKATLSRKISKLEADLGVQLLVRTTRHLSTTELGKKLYHKSNLMLDYLNEITNELHDEKEVPRGTLKVTAGVEFGVSVLNRLIANYQREFNQVTVDLELTGRVVDIVHENIDVAIRIGPLRDSSLKAKKLGEFNYGLYCSPKFLKEHPDELSTIDGLKAVPTLVFKTTERQHSQNWNLFSEKEKTSIKVNPRMLANNHWILAESAANHQGVFFGPSFLIYNHIHQGSLVRVFNEWRSQTIPIHAVFPYTEFVPSSTRSFIDFLSDNVSRLLS